MRDLILKKIATFQPEKSAWQFEQINSLDISIAPFKPFAGNSYIPTPKKIGYRKAIVNVQNKSNHERFKCAVTSAVYPQNTTNPERLSSTLRENSKKFDWTGIDFPSPLNQIDRFERQNPDYAVYVYGYDDSVYFDVLRVCENPEGKM